jgi:hypothetical protein
MSSRLTMRIEPGQWMTVMVWVLPAALIAATAFLAFFGEGLDRLDLLILTISISIPFYAVGALIVSRQPRQAVGWIMWITGGLMVLVLLLTSYGQVSLHGDTLPGSATARVIVEAFWVLPVVLPVTLLPLLFPTGRALSSRWRWVGWLAVTATLGTVIPATSFLWIHRQQFVNDQEFHTPVAIATLLPVGTIAVLLAAIASIISVVIRVRRSADIERQQMKWFLAGVATALAGLIVNSIAPWRHDVNSIAIMVLPVTIGVAILRYRLYDIDHIINKTLVYGALTAILVGIDVSLVIGLEHLLEPVASGSDLIVAGSTLAVAALVRPLRSRIQSVVDRRFYRRKYDAARTLEAFSARLRDQTDLATLATELAAVVQETMQPAHVSLWVLAGQPRGAP